MKICEYCKKEHDGNFGSGRFCSRSCANTKSHSKETRDKISKSVKNSEIFKIKHKESVKRRGLIRERISKTCPICNEPFIAISDKNGKTKTFCSIKCYIFDQKNGHKFSKRPKTGGYNKGSCKSYGGYYKGIWCDSTYELAWVIYNLDHKISFERNKVGFPYKTPDGKDHKYYPDFKQGDQYIEIKNYLKENDEYKFQYFPHNLIILFGNDLQEQFSYVRSEYGKDLKSLYTKKYGEIDQI